MAGSVASVFPAAFPALALAHFAALVSPGPDFFLVIGHAARQRLRGTVFICVGIALGNALYILLAAAGWAGLKQSPALYRALELLGAAYLIWLGVCLLRASGKPAELHLRDAPSLSLGRQLATGLASALLNPKNAVFYLTLMTVIIGPEASLAQQAAAGVWMTLAVFIWDAGLAACIAHKRVQRLVKKNIPLVERIAGLVLIILAAALVAGPLLPDVSSRLVP